jgi:ABC-type multidrug transport system ATPase subunit
VSESPPLLSAVRARIDVSGIPAIDGLTFSTNGNRVLVLGCARALFEAVSGARKVVHGELRVCGVSCDRAVEQGIIAGAPLEYAAWSARLSGCSRRDGQARAKVAIDRLELGDAARIPLGRATRIARRATVIAAAMATHANVIALEDPLANLDDEPARTLGKLTIAALASMHEDGARFLLFAPHASLASPFAAVADEALTLPNSNVESQGAPFDLASRTHTYSLYVTGDREGFAAAVKARGVAISDDGPRLHVDLGDAAKTRDLFAIALETNATIIELRAVDRAFA